MSENNTNNKSKIKKERGLKQYENEENSISFKDNSKDTYDFMKYKLFKP